MNQQETNKILAMMVEVYPSFNNGRNPEVTSKLWSTLFAEEPYEWVEKAFLAFVATDTKGFPPPPGAIKEMIVKLSGEEDSTEMEAWGMVMKALRNSSYNSAEEYHKLPRDVQEIVGSPQQLREWAMMDAGEVGSVVASNFQRSYRARKEARKMFGTLPKSLMIEKPKEEVAALPPTEEEVEKEDYQGVPMPQNIRDVMRKILNLPDGLT